MNPNELQIPENELTEEYIRPASGPGGQHVNRTANSVRLSFHFRISSLLSDAAKARLETLGGSKIVGDDLVFVAKESRSLQMNRLAARERLKTLLEAAMKPVKKRRPTKATKASKERRLETKSRRSGIKSMRSGRGLRDSD